MTRSPPIPSGDAWQELIDAERDPVLRDLMIARRQVGIERYGVPLQRDNGRDMMQDCREELLDAMAYAQALRWHAAVPVLRMMLIGTVQP